MTKDTAGLTGELVTQELVDRFLSWPLPESVCADLVATMPGRRYRTGTNLLSAIEARQMLIYVLASLRPAAEPRNGEWSDKWGACKLCDGEIPYGHTDNCHIWKLEQRITVLTAARNEEIDALLRIIDKTIDPSFDGLIASLKQQIRARKEGK